MEKTNIRTMNNIIKRTTHIFPFNRKKKKNNKKRYNQTKQ